MRKTLLPAGDVMHTQRVCQADRARQRIQSSPSSLVCISRTLLSSEVDTMLYKGDRAWSARAAGDSAQALWRRHKQVYHLALQEPLGPVTI
jgi:outer membrane biogenesis lipoprotein LolB